MQTGANSDSSTAACQLTVAQHPVTTQISCQLNGLSHNQQQAVRMLIRMILLTGTPDTVHDIFQATPFLADLAEHVDHDTSDSEDDEMTGADDNESREMSEDERSSSAAEDSEGDTREDEMEDGEKTSDASVETDSL
ncbi:hypothetical protein VNI00_015258 [Paramarasmius palmivorus]|uniref:Uncharacterized protein n=1 Tax=Paramarasmius palmivorus TaxID=297713 RepID=A0AAW0BLL9_9AGAR